MIRQLLLWKALPEYPGYELQIASDESFASVFEHVPYTTETSHLTGELSTGVCYWRYRGVGLLTSGAWSPVQTFVVHEPWEQPQYYLAPTVCFPVLLRRG